MTLCPVQLTRDVPRLFEAWLEEGDILSNLNRTRQIRKRRAIGLSKPINESAEGEKEEEEQQHREEEEEEEERNLHDRSRSIRRRKTNKNDYRKFPCIEDLISALRRLGFFKFSINRG
ncbi:hypothetical protein AAC387_Pa01g3520 [Persea americana]